MMIPIDVDEGTHERLEALAPPGRPARLRHRAHAEVLRQLDLRRVMSEERERANQQD